MATLNADCREKGRSKKNQDVTLTTKDDGSLNQNNGSDAGEK